MSPVTSTRPRCRAEFRSQALLRVRPPGMTQQGELAMIVRRYLALIFAAVALVGCGPMSSGTVKDLNVRDWIGHSATHLIQSWGTPRSRLPDSRRRQGDWVHVRQPSSDGSQVAGPVSRHQLHDQLHGRSQRHHRGCDNDRRKMQNWPSWRHASATESDLNVNGDVGSAFNVIVD